MKYKLVVYLMIVIPNIGFSQLDSCSYVSIGKYRTYQLTDTKKVNIDRIRGLSMGAIKLSDSISLYDPNFTDIDYYENQIDVFLESEQIDFREYIIQSVFVKKLCKEYLFIILQKNKGKDICYNSYTLFQYGGGNNFCVLLFDAKNNNLLGKKINTWK